MGLHDPKKYGEGQYLPPVQAPTELFASKLLSDDLIDQGLAMYFCNGDRKLLSKIKPKLSEQSMKEFLSMYMGQQKPRGERPYNIILYGASGYTARLAIEYILQHVKNTDFKWALAGRTKSKVEKVKKECFDVFGKDWKGYDPPCFAADLSDPWDVQHLVLSCDVVMNFAGPFLITGGEALVEACLLYRTDYVDVNGEVPYTHALLPYHAYAKASKTLIVPNCAGAGGQADLISAYTASLAEKDGETVRTMKSYITGSTSSVPSGGTLLTRATMTQKMGEVGKIMSNPFALGGDQFLSVRDEDMDKHLSTVVYDRDVKAYRTPFIYAFYETRVVRRSNMLRDQLSGKAYGPEFNYQEFGVTMTQEQAQEAQSSQTSTKAEEEHLKKTGNLKALGDGSGHEERKESWSQYVCVAHTDSGNSMYTARLLGRDGYDETARLSVEMALAIVENRDALPYKGGVLTPSVAGSSLLFDRLRNTGLVLEPYDGGVLDTAKEKYEEYMAKQ